MKNEFNINDSIMTLVSIIQGFAFGYVSTEFIVDFVAPSLSIGAGIKFISYLLCYAIILKFFQTYLLALKDYQGVTIDYFDVIIIFATGIFEFFLFSSLINESHQSFFIKLIVLSCLSIIGYILAIKKVKDLYHKKKHSDKLARELKIQKVNIVSSAIILLISVLTVLIHLTSVANSNLSQIFILTSLLSITLIVMYNNWNSYVKTTKSDERN